MGTSLRPGAGRHCHSFRWCAHVPVTPSSGLPNSVMAAAFNESWFRKALRQLVGRLESIAPFFHPLDRVGALNRLYRPAETSFHDSFILALASSTCESCQRGSGAPPKPSIRGLVIVHVHAVEVVPVPYRRRFRGRLGTAWAIRVDGVDVLKGTTYVDRTRATSDALQIASSLTTLTGRPHEYREST